MEGSRRGKGNKKKGLPIPDPHVDGGNGVKPYYITRRKKEEKGEKKKETKGGRNTTVEKEEFITLSPNTRACPRILFASVRV